MATDLTQRYRTALVTGARTGIGRAISERLLAEGLEVWGTGRDVSALPDLGPRFRRVSLDLADERGAVAAVHRVDGEAGGLDILVNNAGHGSLGLFGVPDGPEGGADRDRERFAAEVAALLVVPAALVSVVLPGMRERRRGAVVNVSSLAVDLPLPGMAAYTAAKAGLSALTETLMLELAGSGVVAVDVRPGDHRTEFGRNLGVPGREPMPEEVALLKRYRAAMEGGPPPERVARALVRMLAAGRSGTVRCGSLFQARIAPMLAWAGPAAWRRAGIRRYHGLSKASFS